jgi:diaminohydroxyphosphoribosylaminopyrimidine deaminase/5-amino-6-(5-phosphoribosylamino)uracil reductase
MMAEAEKVNVGFLKRMRTGFPYVQLKMAASLDGRTAMASGESQWITSPQARQDVQRFRAQSAAILSSSATVLADDPSLTVRWSELGADVQKRYSEANLRQPVRVIVDSRQRVTPQHRIVSQPGETWLARVQADEQAWPHGVEQVMLPQHNGGVDLVALMMVLGRRQINSVWVEAGASLAGALLNAGVVDELIVYLAPKLLGENARSLCLLPGLDQLSQAPEFDIADVRQIGPDLRLRLKPKF